MYPSYVRKNKTDISAVRTAGKLTKMDISVNSARWVRQIILLHYKEYVFKYLNNNFIQDSRTNLAVSIA